MIIIIIFQSEIQRINKMEKQFQDDTVRLQ